eukprot:TRINITY_DN3355_c0_g1_i1.p1 TRINITY_DN3355_c0_g1~~TRINITY_DN3355_c0_g1_i1.p1  ORF type:complete len:194 (+),score=49.34 TRINITY_DN3355_c0_g1_i1:225-806(+)
MNADAGNPYLYGAGVPGMPAPEREWYPGQVDVMQMQALASMYNMPVMPPMGIHQGAGVLDGVPVGVPHTVPSDPGQYMAMENRKMRIMMLGKKAEELRGYMDKGREEVSKVTNLMKEGLQGLKEELETQKRRGTGDTFKGHDVDALLKSLASEHTWSSPMLVNEDDGRQAESDSGDSEEAIYAAFKLDEDWKK